MVELDRTQARTSTSRPGTTTRSCWCGDVIDEPVVAYGPFVMNTEEEIREAYLEYQSGKFGRVGG